MKEASITSSIVPSFSDTGIQTPHCLLHLSAKEWRRCKLNSINVTGLFKSNITAYDNVVFGSNIKAPLKKSTSHGSTINWQEINLSEIKGGYAIITTSIDELKEMMLDNRVILIDSTEGSTLGRASNTKASLSGIVLLAVMQLDKTLKKRGGFKWGRDHYNCVTGCKNNIMMLSNKHHESTGHYFSWGNKGNYGMKGNSSVGQYACKNGVNSELNSKFIVHMMNSELQDAISNFKSILPILPSVVAPVIRVAHELQSTVGDINITKPLGANVGIWQSSLSVNAVTKGLHTEDDVTYSTISVPLQKIKSAERKYHFIFQLNRKCIVSLPLIEGTTLLFSGKLLTHRQSCNVFEAMDDELFFNFASYGNKKLFNHIRKSFIRS